MIAKQKQLYLKHNNLKPKMNKNEVPETITSTHKRYMSDSTELADVTARVKSLFLKARDDSKSLSELLDEYLIPQDIERKENAEISTPHRLRNEMLDSVPADFWSDVTYTYGSSRPQYPTVFEPCCGKGGFLLDVVDRLMTGLAEAIPDESERYRVVVEECLYWADINPLNVYVCRLLLDPEGKYELLYWQGDTLELDVGAVWGVESFGLVVGNPPYNKNLYKKFTLGMLDIAEMLLFVIPSTFTVGVSHENFVARLLSHGLKDICYLDRKAFNNSIDIDTLFLLSVSGYEENLCVNGVVIGRDFPIRNYSCEDIGIFEKIRRQNPLLLLKGKNHTLTYKNPKETESIRFSRDAKHPHELLSRLGNGEHEIYYIDVPKKSSEKYALVFPRGTASYNNRRRLLDLSRDIVYSACVSPGTHLSTGICYIEVEDELEAKHLQWYMMRSKLVRYLFLKLNVFSELTVGFVQNIPDIRPSVCEDSYVYEVLGLTDKEIEQVEASFN